VEPISPATQEYFIATAKYATIALIAIVAGLTIVGSIAFLKTEKDGAKTFSLLIERAGALQLVTVLAIVVGACFLTIIGKINTEGIVSILSGIAGYVLGGISRTGRGHPNEPDK
jgi:hypothetical protein